MEHNEAHLSLARAVSAAATASAALPCSPAWRFGTTCQSVDPLSV